MRSDPLRWQSHGWTVCWRNTLSRYLKKARLFFYEYIVIYHSLTAFWSVVAEWQRKIRRSSCGSVYGSRQSHQANGTNWLHQICPHPDVWDCHEGNTHYTDWCVSRKLWLENELMTWRKFVQLFPQIEEIMVQPLRDSRDHYEELKQIDDAMSEVRSKFFDLTYPEVTLDIITSQLSQLNHKI